MQGDLNAALAPNVLPVHRLAKIDEENYAKNTLEDGSLSPNSDPEDIELNLQILLKIDEAIRSDLSELLASHNLNDLNESELPNYRFSKNSYKELNGFQQDDSGVSANGFHLDDEEKSFIEMDALSDLGSQSVSCFSVAIKPFIDGQILCVRAKFNI